jgi:predicted enzyme related to lactoylglutathione lyase
MVGMLELGTTVITVEDMDRAGAFWRGALGYVNRSEPGEDWVILDPPGGPGAGPSIALSKTGYPQHYPPRLHLDLYASDQTMELARLRALGARDVDWVGYPADADYVVMEDTEGNRFCVVDAPEWFEAASGVRAASHDDPL